MLKTKRIDIRLTPEEKEVLVKRAHKKNFNLTEYILYCILKDISGDRMKYKETEGWII